MNKYYRQVHKKKASGADEDDELALTMNDEKKNEQQPKKKFNGNCHKCGKKGHMARNCWLNPKNKGKQPKWWDESKAKKSSNEVAASGVGNRKSDEPQLVNMSWGYCQEAFDSEDEEEIQKMENEIAAIKHTEKQETSAETMLKAAIEDDKGTGIELLEDPEIFVLDTGATTHSTGHGDGITDMQEGNGRTTKMGNGAKVATKAVGIMPFKTKDGTHGKMSGVHLTPGAPFNLISGTKLLAMGFEMCGTRDNITYKRDGIKIIFDVKIKNPEGMLFAARLQRTATEVGGAIAQEKTVSIKTAHELLGHMNEADTHKAAKAMGWTVTRGSLGVCESCAKGKAKQKMWQITVMMDPKQRPLQSTAEFTWTCRD